MNSTPAPASPWHDGERAIQQRLGVAQRMEEFGRKVIRDFMPDQHRQFYAQLPLLVLGTVDAEGLPWASVLEGQHGFAHSPDAKALRIDALLWASDPARTGLAPGEPLGLLGIELHSRRRNRLNGRVSAQDVRGLTVAVEQAFGNCPQYIQTRDESSTRRTEWPPDGDAEQLAGLDDAARTMISAADTFFVASYVDPDGDISRRQVDVSHRGGKSGFVRIDGETLTIPDFAGNLQFNTLGNLLVNPRAGLLFLDFASGDLLQLSGRTEIVFDGGEVSSFQGAERLWRVTVERAVRRRGALRTRFAFGEFSPNSLLTGSWEQAAARRAAAAMRREWRPMRVSRIEQESATVLSFHLEPADGAGAATHLAGQHLPIRLTLPGFEAPTLRTYTLSSAPSDAHYRISVKRQGAVSSHLHDRIKVGDTIEARAPQGTFTLDAALRRPVVLLSGGVGVTPMLAML
ncbi:MAG: pyridoxamine 5'-phosphate oxidase family protein, partial [Betaproteobacteria bacterium]